ncbi:unnamed protein product [Phaedon cochleariae]|uniref:Rab proteins geranylgeranyltransferase component A n=1 Tax=Phaedon cochleariae TaxID=80249 RepID=A0A9P0GJK6_PHACE|nr:unnamed protein product [Phaedon cochleariae]
MDYTFPEKFDLIVVGTGVVESMLSAAASRVGKTVLHIDTNDYYGGQWASFNLETITKLKNDDNSSSNVRNPLVLEENTYCLGNNVFNVENVQFKYHIPNIPKKSDVSEDTSNMELDEKWSSERLLKESRKFNIDLAPKLQFGRGDFVGLLISSNISRYAEYRCVSRIITWLNGKLHVVPCSRADVFSNTNVTVIEKRMLMKVLTSLNDPEEDMKNYENQTFKDFLIDKKLSPNLIHFILYGISMSSDETPFSEGVGNAKRFLNSLGRFGKTPFLYSMYGSGELPQAFCRLSAVFGGVFALGQTPQGIIMHDNKFKSLKLGSQHLEADHLIMSVDNSPQQFITGVEKKYISRAVLITSSSMIESEKEHLTLLFYPPENGKNTVTLIELGSLTGTCPKGLFLVHLISRQNISPEEDFKHVVENLFLSEPFETPEENETARKPEILWSAYFSLPDTSESDLKSNVPDNVFLCPGPDLDLDYDGSIKMARDIFKRMYDDLEFLPRAPDPEEIILGEDEEGE